MKFPTIKVDLDQKVNTQLNYNKTFINEFVDDKEIYLRFDGYNDETKVAYFSGNKVCYRDAQGDKHTDYEKYKTKYRYDMNTKKLELIVSDTHSYCHEYIEVGGCVKIIVENQELFNRVLFSTK